MRVGRIAIPHEIEGDPLPKSKRILKDRVSLKIDSQFCVSYTFFAIC